MRAEKLGCGAIIAYIFVLISIWGAGIYVIVHFIKKFW
jgi:hypothetical protein